MTRHVQQVFAHEWPSGTDLPLAQLAVRLEELAGRTGLHIETWEEDGIGPACGVCCQLPSGRVVLLRELAFAVEHLGAPGPEVLADMREAVTVGVAPFLAEVLEAFDLSPTDTQWVQVDRAEQFARDWLNARDRGSPPPDPRAY